MENMPAPATCGAVGTTVAPAAAVAATPTSADGAPAPAATASAAAPTPAADAATPAPAPAIQFECACKRFGDTVALDDVSLSIERGTFATLIGSSGCGTTTLLKTVNALVTPDGGRVLVNGRDVMQADPIQLRRSIGYAIQGSVLFPHLTVERNIAFVPSLFNRKDTRRTTAAVEKWMEIVGLPPSLKGRYPAELSGGQQQRVGIARALAASPDILLMDEPFSAVDEITRAALQDEIRAVHERTGITILFVTHDIDEALGLGERVLVMEAGRVVQYAPPREVLAHPATPFATRLVARKQRVYARG